VELQEQEIDMASMARGPDTRRQVQEGSSNDGLLTAVGLVASVLIGFAGYMVQARSAREAEGAAAELARGQQEMDATKQQLHAQVGPLCCVCVSLRRMKYDWFSVEAGEEMLLTAHRLLLLCAAQMGAQIVRTDRWLDDCFRPINLTLMSVYCSRYAFITKAAVELEMGAPEVVAHMLQQTLSMIAVDPEGGRAVNVRDGTLLWDAQHARNVSHDLTRSHGTIYQTSETATAISVAAVDLMLCSSQPWCRELSEATVTADPTSPFARRFRLFVKYDLVPEMRRVTQLLETHVAVVELPPVEWMKKKFPGEPWHIQPISQYQVYWIVRTRQWEAVLADWEDDEFGVMHPVGHLLPLTGLHMTNGWAIKRGETLQCELIGMTTEVKRTTQIWGEVLARGGTIAAEGASDSTT
jgi:hypothetical protein